MTYGQVKFRISKAFPGVDADLVEGWITDCYLEILGALPWSRLDQQAILTTTAPYSTGTVNVTNGSNAVSLAGGAWTAGMSGLTFHATGDQEEYTFTFASATTGTLDRPYAGATDSTSGYAIYQAIYTLPSNCRFLDEEAFSNWGLGPLRRLGVEEGQARVATAIAAPSSAAVPCAGVPSIWWPVMDDSSTPPNMRVRFFPVPDKVYGIPLTYATEAAAPGSTSTTLAPWLQPAAIIEGTTAKVKRHLKDYPGAQFAKAAFTDALAVMVNEEAYRRGPLQMQMSSYYTRHRLRRTVR